MIADIKTNVKSENPTTDTQFMRRALALALKGAGWVNPNPMVGAVVVRDGCIIGEGFHAMYGESHAEAVALDGLTPEQTSGATLYVTLEPCNHQGKTPPCAPLIATMGIRRVVIAAGDPNPEVNGQGIKYLQAHGIEVETGLLKKEAEDQNEVFRTYITTGNPFVVLKTAMTLDGKIATVTNASRWITGEPSRRLVHRLRSRLSSVLVGVNTVLYDDPLLNIRLKGNHPAPLKVIADTHGRIPVEARVLANNPQLTLVATTASADSRKMKDIERMGAQVLVCPAKEGRVDLTFLLRSLGAMGVDSVLAEGGSTLAFSLLRDELVDKMITFIAPKVLGGEQAPTAVGGAGIDTMEEAVTLERMAVKRIGSDLMVTGYPIRKLHHKTKET